MQLLSSDPFTFEMIRHKLHMVVAEAMDALKNVSGSPSTSEALDMMVSLYDRNGNRNVRKPLLPIAERGGVDPTAALVEKRRAWNDNLGVYEEVDGYSFDLIRPGNVIHGPAIVWTPITTIVLRSSDTGEMDERANLLLTPSFDAASRGGS